MFEVAVIGGGPAGAAAAITAARAGTSIVMLEAGDFPRHKVCGEFVSAESLALLRELVREHPQAHEIFHEAPLIESARFFHGHRVARMQIAPAAISIPRYTLDLLLWESAIQAGVTARARCEVQSIEGEGPFSIRTSQGEVRAGAVIVCTGRWSRFSQVTELPVGPRWLGLKAHYRERNPAQCSDLYFFEHGYCGVQPVGRDLVNVCAMVRADVATSLEQVFRRSAPLAARAESWEVLMPAATTSPLVYRTPEPVRGKLLLAGDAAAFIDPFVGDGIALALRSGQTAVQCLQPFLGGQIPIEVAAEDYQRIYGRDFLPAITAAAQVRNLHYLPEFGRSIALQLFRIPGVLPYLMRRTRSA